MNRIKRKQKVQQEVSGIDVSRHQGTIDWAQVRQAGTRFAFAKATEGSSWNDPKFVENRSGAAKNGVAFGAYHFFRPRADVGLQIKNFVSAVGSLRSGELPPVLDVEVPAPWQRYSGKKRVELITTWMNGVESALGVKPILYLSPSFAKDTLGSAAELSAYPLWIAHYTSRSQPTVPAPWSGLSPDWTFWQYTERGKVAGVAGYVDRDRFFGDEVALSRLLVE